MVITVSLISSWILLNVEMFCVWGHYNLFCIWYTRYNFSSYLQAIQYLQHKYFNLTVWLESYSVNSKRRLKSSQNEWKGRLCEHLVIWLTCAANTESLANMTKNCIVYIKYKISYNDLIHKIIFFYCSHYTILIRLSDWNQMPTNLKRCFDLTFNIRLLLKVCLKE
jgi:hypothetical protein